VSRAAAALLLARLGLLAWVAFVLWSSLAPASMVPLAANVSDKVLHAMAYGLLAALATLSLKHPRPLVVLVTVVAFGLLLEVLQRQTGYRTFEWTDLLADAVGAVVGITAALIARDVSTRQGRD
jgi:VanZ family protein